MLRSTYTTALALIALVAFAGCAPKQASVGRAPRPISALDPELPRNAPVTQCDPHDFGAVGDGQHNDQQSIQAAIDSCVASGGGTVLLSQGTFLSGPIFLRTNITLQISADATLLGTQDPAAYDRVPGWPDVGRSVVGLVNAGSGETDVTITGSGTIDGAGAWWWQFHLANRPRMVVFYRCRRVLVEGVTLTNSPSFHLLPAYSQDVTIRNVLISSPTDSPNTDGIDPSDSRNVSISNSTIDTGDDNIAIKAGHVDPAHPGESSADIMVSDCTFLHGHGMSIGSETTGGVRRVTVSRCTFQDTVSALRIKTNRDVGGEVSFITYQNITITNVRNPISLTAYYPDNTVPAPGDDSGQPVTDSTPNFHDITIQSMTATGTNNAADRLIGVPELPFNNISLSDVQISAVPSGVIVRNASIFTHNVTIMPGSGPPFVAQENGQITDR